MSLPMFGINKDKLPVTSKQIDTVIAEHCTLTGDLATKNSVKIDGRIKGTLRVEGRAIIGVTGIVEGDVHAEDLQVLGRLEGNVFAQRLHLQNHAHILGNIEAQALQVDTGAHYQGSVTMRDAKALGLALSYAGTPDDGVAKPA
jgi:cytoskeletal protein CcmA (bactofilin family)